MIRPSTRVRYMAGMVVDATGSGMYLPLSLLFFHHVTGLPIERVGVIMTGAALFSLVANPIAGVLVDRFGARAVVVGGYLVRAVGFAAYPLVDSPLTMFLAVALVALGDGSYPPSIQSFVAAIAQGADRDRLLAAQRSLRNAGLGAGGLIAGAALGLGSDAAYRVIVLVSAAAFAGAALILRTIPVPGGPVPGARIGTAPRAAGRRSGGYRLVLRDRTFLALTLQNVPTAFGYMVLSVALPVYVTQELDVPASLVGVLYAVNTVGIALLQIPVTRRLIRYRRTRTVAAGAATFAASFAAFALLAGVPVRPVALAGVFAATALFTLGEMLHGAPLSALVSSAAPEETRGRYMAVYQFSWAIPITLAPAVLTALLSLSPVSMWLLLAGGVSCSALTMLRLEPRLPARAVHARIPEDPEETDTEDRRAATATQKAGVE
ncbi:Predicted arabinose efflux permease, MFS family [Microbispora rosea]|uniref:Predicted arabinose efflux permease, MFS family n=1 Tax=Microbispora rosea TaxID=58117 RepID=A0A1N7E1N2_9ACTN|nr:MFS transporter [Microbispora rosea]GIH47998.1 MFS transporter [Microbispora rosea subsp. rosea]SIR81989.1 Predicted arabinose efflux permease, MFS family [Microbispora rosea]